MDFVDGQAKLLDVREERETGLCIPSEGLGKMMSKKGVANLKMIHLSHGASMGSSANSPSIAMSFRLVHRTLHTGPKQEM
jgi:hypothetical protein